MNPECEILRYAQDDNSTADLLSVMAIPATDTPSAIHVRFASLLESNVHYTGVALE